MKFDRREPNKNVDYLLFGLLCTCIGALVVMGLLSAIPLL